MRGYGDSSHSSFGAGPDSVPPGMASAGDASVRYEACQTEPDALRYRAVEVEPRRLEELRARLGDVVELDDGTPIEGLVLGNEVLDALPTHRVIGTGRGLDEVYVAVVDGRLADAPGPPSTPALGARLAAEGITLAEGQLAEICLATDAWVAGAAAGLAKGLLLLIDYGHPAVLLYDNRRRPRGTLAAYVSHRIHDDPYRAIGRQDLTAHVDVTAVEVAAAAAGLEPVATTTQGRFLAGLGVGELLVALQSGPDADLAGYLDAKASLVRMIDPAAMGRFAVMAFGRGLPVDAPLRGLTATVPDPT